MYYESKRYGQTRSSSRHRPSCDSYLISDASHFVPCCWFCEKICRNELAATNSLQDRLCLNKSICTLSSPLSSKVKVHLYLHDMLI